MNAKGGWYGVRFPGLLGGALLILTACGDGGRVGGGVSGRPSDGLLADPDLQEVVERQEARDGAALISMLAEARPEVRARAALALASVQDTAAQAALVAALGDESPAVRRDAAFALGQLSAVGAADALTEALEDEADPEVRARLVEALGKTPSVEASHALLGLSLEPDEEHLRALAVARLGATRGVLTVEGKTYLLAHLSDADDQVRSASAYLFGRLANAGPWEEEAGDVRRALDGYGPSDPAAMYLVQALGRLGHASDGPRLRGWLADGDDWRTRSNAAAALGLLPQETGNREALFAALDDPNPNVAASAGWSLGRGTPVPSDLQKMKSWIEANPDRFMAAAPLLVALAQADEREFVLAWMDALPQDDAYRWSVGLQAMGYVAGAEGIRRLERAVDNPDSRIRGGAVRALVDRWQKDRDFAANHDLYFRIFARVLLDRESLGAAYAAAEALGDPLFTRFGSVTVLSDAYRIMEPPRDLEPMMAVLQSLGGTGSLDALPVVREAATSPYPALRELAGQILESAGEAAPAYGEQAAAGDDAADAEDAPETPALDWTYLASLGPAPSLVLETTRGTVRLQLRTEDAPLTVQTITRLASEGKYDGVPFHRVVPNFVVQGGDYSSGDGFGGPGFTIDSEFTLIPYRTGTVGMASAGKDTEGSQFFITHSPQPHLDGAYTTFGWVVAGQDVVDQLQVGDRIVRASVEPGA